MRTLCGVGDDVTQPIIASDVDTRCRYGRRRIDDPTVSPWPHDSRNAATGEPRCAAWTGAPYECAAMLPPWFIQLHAENSVTNSRRLITCAPPRSVENHRVSTATVESILRATIS